MINLTFMLSTMFGTDLDKRVANLPRKYLGEAMTMKTGLQFRPWQTRAFI
jgi:hypothetical protein